MANKTKELTPAEVMEEAARMAHRGADGKTKLPRASNHPGVRIKSCFDARISSV